MTVAVLMLGATAIAGPRVLNDQAARAGCPFPYVVGFGDTLSAIGLRYGVWWTDIAVTNNLTNPNLIYPGQVLTIPCPVGQTSFGVGQVSTTVAIPTPTPASSLPAAATPGTPPGCYIGDGNACYGPGESCSTTQDWIRGKETCIALGLGTNESTADLQTQLPVVFGGSELLINGHMRGGYESDGGHVCGIVVLRRGEPTIIGAQASASAREIGEAEAIDAVKEALRQMGVDCGGGYERSIYDNFLGRRQ